MCQNKRQSGFALTEVLLAIVAISVSVVSSYYLYNYITIQQKNSRTSNQIISMVSVYSDLYSAHLTSDISTESELINSFYSSNRMPANTFVVNNGTVSQMKSYYGDLSFSNINNHAFTVIVPVNDNTDGSKNQICDKVKDYVLHCSNNNDASVTVSINVGEY